MVMTMNAIIMIEMAGVVTVDVFGSVGDCQ